MVGVLLNRILTGIRAVYGVAPASALVPIICTMGMSPLCVGTVVGSRIMTVRNRIVKEIQPRMSCAC
jgi:hypothetical protein